MQLIQFNLDHLDKTLINQQDIEYNQIIDYEIVRESICSLIFKLSRQAKLADSEQQEILQKNISKLIYIRDHLQIHDRTSIQKIMSEIRSYQ
ncbi:hypothetical protein [Acinetobacter sp. YH12117]|uniref:hypothetical protein n=1 Tax=Acinetobacter sp. YH12117 TaxID=2601104 RepID=UPI0015D33927|nr:hypothetical protein [Acinetobacter sp. YH12117]